LELRLSSLLVLEKQKQNQTWYEEKEMHWVCVIFVQRFFSARDSVAVLFCLRDLCAILVGVICDLWDSLFRGIVSPRDLLARDYRAALF
jgi:hypothetical protein